MIVFPGGLSWDKGFVARTTPIKSLTQKVSTQHNFLYPEICFFASVFLSFTRRRMGDRCDGGNGPQHCITQREEANVRSVRSGIKQHLSECSSVSVDAHIYERHPHSAR